MITKPFGFCSQVEIRWQPGRVLPAVIKRNRPRPGVLDPYPDWSDSQIYPKPAQTLLQYLSSTVYTSLNIAYAAGPGGGQRAEIRFEIACSWPRGGQRAEDGLMPTIGSPSAWRRLCFVLPVIAIVILCSTAMRAPVGVGPATKVVALGPGGRFRSQAGQDLYVYERFFRHRPGPGVYLEFGARDGVVHSNSYAFEQRGWRGFCVEPTDEFHRLVRNRPGCWNYHGAVAARAGARRFVFSKKGGFSGFADDMDPARLEAMRRRGKVARETSVACYTVAGLMRERRVERLDYVSVDVEGAELEVLRSVDWAATPADVVQVESVEGAAKNDTAALVALMARWYHLDVKYDVSPPPCRPGEVTADCTYDLIFVSRRFARDLRARNVSLTPAGARALWKRTYGPPAGRGEEPPGWRRA